MQAQNTYISIEVAHDSARWTHDLNGGIPDIIKIEYGWSTIATAARKTERAKAETDIPTWQEKPFLGTPMQLHGYIRCLSDKAIAIPQRPSSPIYPHEFQLLARPLNPSLPVVKFLRGRLGKVVRIPGHRSTTAKAKRIRVKSNPILSWLRNGNPGTWCV